MAISSFVLSGALVALLASGVGLAVYAQAGKVFAVTDGDSTHGTNTRSTQLPVPLANDVLLRCRVGSSPLRGRWGIVGRVQAGLKDALAQCGKPSVEVDGVFGRNSHEALRRLATCPRFSTYKLGRGEANDGAVTEALWRALLPTEGIPDVRERAFGVWVTHEATDYDRVEFNFVGTGEPQPNDPKSYLTWGPYGATAGHGREVQGILGDGAVGVRLPTCFDGEAEALARLVTASDAQAAEIVRDAYVDPSRRRAWKSGFACLASDPPARRGYDAYAFDGDRWFRPAVRRLYTLVPDGRTAIDFAFFVDLAMHMGITAARLSAARDARASLPSLVGRFGQPSAAERSGRHSSPRSPTRSRTAAGGTSSTTSTASAKRPSRPPSGRRGRRGAGYEPRTSA